MILDNLLEKFYPVLEFLQSQSLPFFLKSGQLHEANCSHHLSYKLALFVEKSSLSFYSAWPQLAFPLTTDAQNNQIVHHEIWDYFDNTMTLTQRLVASEQDHMSEASQPSIPCEFCYAIFSLP